jgi:hypothetical protein
MPDVEIIAICRKNHTGHITHSVKKRRFFCYAWRHTQKMLGFKSLTVIFVIEFCVLYTFSRFLDICVYLPPCVATVTICRVL